MAGGSFTEKGKQYPVKMTVFVFLACLVASSGGLIFGCDIGISGGVTSMDPFLKQFFPSVYAKEQEFVLGTLIAIKFGTMGVASISRSYAMGVIFLMLLCHLKFGLFYFFGAWEIAMTLFVYFFLPETKGIPIEEMDRIWANHWYWNRFVDGATAAAHLHRRITLVILVTSSCYFFYLEGNCHPYFSDLNRRKLSSVVRLDIVYYCWKMLT
ncbi:unnamed protein product [Miscanthus lutarioriparius]|uniref:Major facilitator superfamily (MFS) profile domain-containing protein n=1 Tax=Miscanthus lutarioriparius TaxID=422564 RepID=A0A811P252_9POAL|nr:unnamed protein product [Miscanthus lutarioriparius]